VLQQQYSDRSRIGTAALGSESVVPVLGTDAHGLQQEVALLPSHAAASTGLRIITGPMPSRQYVQVDDVDLFKAFSVYFNERELGRLVPPLLRPKASLKGRDASRGTAPAFVDSGS
jgi:hypothetical protein